MFADLVPGTGSVSVSVGSLDRARCGGPARGARPLSVPLLGADHEPRAAAALCQRSRQATRSSRSTPNTDQRIRDAIDALLTRQDSNGSFGLWSVGGDDVWLDSYVTDFLTRARERKIRGAGRAPSSSRSTGCATPSPTSPIRARTAAAISPMRSTCWRATARRRSAICAISPTPSSTRWRRRSPRRNSPRRWPWSATGRAPSASMPRRSAAIAPSPQPDLIGREDYGSTLRDAAALVTLASRRRRRSRATVQAAVQRVEAARANLRPTSTQEDAWLVLAASAMAKDAGKVSLDVGGEAVDARALSHHPRRRPEGSRCASTNTGEEPVQAVVTVSGAPVTPEPAARKRLQDRAPYLHARRRSGRHRRQVKQNTRLVVVLKVTEAQPQFGRVIVADYLPAGFEIDNPHLVSSGDTGTLSWITDAAEPVRHRVPRRSLHRGVRAQERRSRRCSPSPMSCARSRPENTCGRRRTSRTCTVPTATAAPRPRTSRSRRRNERRRVMARSKRRSSVFAHKRWIAFARTRA